LRVDNTQGQLLASAVPGQPLQRVPALTLVGVQASWQLGRGLELGAGVENLTGLRLSEKSPLFTYAEAPRTLRLSLRGRW
jgi:outer membrane receptor for ferrienterochelin and colicins